MIIHEKESFKGKSIVQKVHTSQKLSHMAIVNQLSASNRRRDKMVNYRNAFTYAANISILILALSLFAASSATDSDA